MLATDLIKEGFHNFRLIARTDTSIEVSALTQIEFINPCANLVINPGSTQNIYYEILGNNIFHSITTFSFDNTYPITCGPLTYVMNDASNFPITSSSMYTFNSSTILLSVINND